MSLIVDYAQQVWDLLLTLGWWSMLGCLLCGGLLCLPRSRGKKWKNMWSVLLAAAAGALLPMCNFAAIPLAVGLLIRGAGTGTVLAFLSGATLLNPAGILSALAYMGPELTIAYALSAIAAALLTGAAGSRISPEKRPELSRSIPACLELAAQVCFWVTAGILAEAALLTVLPAGLWQAVMLDPSGVSFPEMAAAAVFRHVCIPDDVSLAASLVATGLRPGWAVLFLLLGVSSNLPELFVLYGTAGKKTAALHAVVMVVFSMAAALVVEGLLGAGFVPQFNLANAEGYTQLANRLSIRTWMAAKVPCAAALAVLALWSCRNRRK